MTTIYLTTNSPGEVSTWLRPVVKALRSGAGGHAIAPERIVVFLNPCVYATGNEARVAQEIAGVETVITPWETVQYALAGRRPRALRQRQNTDSVGGKGALLHLGGEIKLSAWLARRLKVPAFLYTEGFVNSVSAFQR